MGWKPAKSPACVKRYWGGQKPMIQQRHRTRGSDLPTWESDDLEVVRERLGRISRAADVLRTSRRRSSIRSTSRLRSGSETLLPTPKRWPNTRNAKLVFRRRQTTPTSRSDPMTSRTACRRRRRSRSRRSTTTATPTGSGERGTKSAPSIKDQSTLTNSKAASGDLSFSIDIPPVFEV